MLASVTITNLGLFLSLFPTVAVACPVAAFPRAEALVSLAGRKFVFAMGTSVNEHTRIVLFFLSAVKSLLETDSQLGAGH